MTRELLEAFDEHLRATRSPRTVANYRRIAVTFLASLDGEPPTRRTVEQFLGRSREDGGFRAVTTRNQELAALRVLSATACMSGIWTSSPTAGIPLLREPHRNPTVLNAAELRRLFETASGESDRLKRGRNLALLAVLSQAGLRVHEAVALNVDQVDLDTGTLLSVHGKGGTVSDVPLNAEATALLRAWVTLRTETYGVEDHALFPSRRGRLSIRSVERLFERLRAKLPSQKRITPHTMRHSAATLCLMLGADLSTVGDLLRHANLNTTRKYVHLVDQRAREAVRRLGSTVPRSVIDNGVERISSVKFPTVELPASPPQNSVDDLGSLADVA